MTMLLSMAAALGLTLVLELAFALIWGLRKKELLLVVLMNILTNPAVNLLYLLAYQVGWNSVWLILLLETAAVVTEGFCCRDVIRRPWLFALLVNLFSYGTGELLKLFI